MSMLIPLDALLSLNVPLDIVSKAVVIYWIASGVIVQVLLTIIDKRIPVGFCSHTIETTMTRHLFYFIAGGIILPILVLLTPPLFILALAGKLFEEKVNRKRI